MLNMAVFAPIPSASVTIATAENAGFLINCRNASRRLLIPKCDHWIDPGGAARRNKTGSGGNQSKHSGDGKINGRIEGVDFEQNIFQRGGCDHSQQQRNAAGAENKANAELPRSLRHHHSENSRCVRTQCHANAEFLGPLVHRKTHHAVKTDSGENEGDDSKNGKQRRDDAIARENFIVKSSRRSGKIGWKVRIEFGNRFAQRRAKNVSPLTCPRTNKDRAKLRSRRCAQQWHVKSHALGLLIERTLHQGVWHHSDNGSPRLRIGRIKNPNLMPDPALVAPTFPGTPRIPNCHRLFRIPLVDGEIAAFENFQTKRREIIVLDRFEISARPLPLPEIIMAVYLILTLGV